MLLGPEFENSIKNIVDMGFPRDEVIQAMKAAYNNPDRAIQYLTEGIPEDYIRQLAGENANNANSGNIIYHLKSLICQPIMQTLLLL